MSPLVFSHRKDGSRPSLGMIGVGAFGALAILHLAPHFRIRAFDPTRNLGPIADQYGIHPASLRDAASCDVVVLSVPVQKLSDVVEEIHPFVRGGSLVLDVCSVKSGPTAILSRLPAAVRIVGTHPLFGPQSGRGGIAGLPIALVPIREKASCRAVAVFLRRRLKLKVTSTTAEDHDRQMAHVQGLTHMISRILLSMPAPELTLTTTAFDHLKAMVSLLQSDSDALFHAICGENPFVGDVIRNFLETSDKVGALFGANAPETRHAQCDSVRIAAGS